MTTRRSSLSSSSPLSRPSLKKTRCAIYTRVSTDQGLDQEFNSLDAQREAAEASVKSQAMMQRMIAADIRQEAARVAHDNTVRKRNAMFGAQFRNDMQTMFKK